MTTDVCCGVLCPAGLFSQALFWACDRAVDRTDSQDPALVERAFSIQTRAHPHVWYDDKEWSLPDVVLGAQLLSYAPLFCHPVEPHARLLCLWGFPEKNTGVGCHFLLQGIFLTHGLDLWLLHWQVDSFIMEPPGKPILGMETRCFPRGFRKGVSE